MQVPKEEIREDILGAAEYEFIKRGYKAASMRMIAKRAKTTIGNIYHYFENKEAILEALVGGIPEEFFNMFLKHKEVAEAYLEDHLDYMDIKKMEGIIEEWLPKLFRFDLILSKPIVILLEGCEGTKFQTFRNDIVSVFRGHLREHVDMYPEGCILNRELFTNAVVESIMAAIIVISKTMQTEEEAMNALTKYIKMILIGMMYESPELFIR